mgnify:CR=1 FL=1
MGYHETPTEQHLVNKRIAKEERASYLQLRDRQTAKAMKAQGHTIEYIAAEMKLPLATIRRYTRNTGGK